MRMSETKKNAAAEGAKTTRRRVLKGSAAVAASAAAAPFPRAFAQTGALDVVKGTLSPIVSYAPVFCAVEKGLFAKYGIKNQIDNVGISASLPIVARGDYDWGRSSNGPGYFNALNSGLAIRGVVDRLTYICSGDNGLVVSTPNYEAGVRNFADLKGKKIGLNAPGTATDYWISQLLANNNMDKSDIHLVQVSYPDLLTGMSTGSIDAGFLPEPLMTKGIVQGSIKLIMPIIELAQGDNIGVMFFGERFIDKAGGDIAMRWLMGYLEGVRFAQNTANRDAVLDIVAKKTRVERNVLARIYDRRTTWPQADPNGRVDVQKMLNGPGQFFLATEMLDKLPPAQRIFDPTLLKEALKEVGEVPKADYLVCNI